VGTTDGSVKVKVELDEVMEKFKDVDDDLREA